MATIIRAPDRRIHVLRPQDWGSSAGTDFWAVFGDLTLVAADPSDLDLYGWLTNNYLHRANTGAGFLDSSDVGATGGLDFDAAGDFITSPFIFGDYQHARMAEAILGYAPTKLFLECWARFDSNTGDENETGFGFIEGAGSAITIADQMAYISVGASLFELHSGAAEDAGAAQDTDPHLWRVELTFGGSAEWFIDGTSQGSIAIQANLWPVAFSAGTKASSGANDVVVAWTHIGYA